MDDKKLPLFMDDKKLQPLKEMDIPYYVQIYDSIYQMIRDGRLKEGDSLPGENILARHWGVSRSTVRMAVRRLEEDGYIYKTQGRRAMITGQLARNKDGLHHISNPCISSCLGTVTRVDAIITVQNGGRLVSELLGCGGKTFTAVAVNMKYFAEEVCVASSVAIIPVLRLDEEGIAVDDQERIKELALSGIYGRAGRSRLSMSVLDWSEETDGQLCCPTVIVMDEVFYEEEVPLSYHKYRMDSSWYRFAMDRRQRLSGLP